ncbi:IclR family transcriptional regulator [Sphingobium sp. BS19]|uniref:IclR family transcriptional regulator n=1 Tax=Sphingobium sp. BS19 TaxID=3018973 RepID=UPI0035CEB2B2
MPRRPWGGRKIVDSRGEDPEAEQNSPANINKAAMRVLLVLSALAERNSPSEIKTLCTQLGMSRNMVFRALTTLVEQGYVVRDRVGNKYDIGYGVLNLRGHENPEPDIRSICHRFLQELHILTSESVFLSIFAGYNRFNIDGIEAKGPRVTHVQRGRPLPLHITITGRTMLAALTDAEIQDYIDAVTFSDFPEAIAATPEILWDEIKRIREEGFGFSRGETLPGLKLSNFAAFVVHDALGRPHASLTVGGPASRFTLERMNNLLPEMKLIIQRANLALRQFPAHIAFWRGDRPHD